ncbi:MULTISPECIES: hypothetical protein [unclassified Nonomuraea]|uniref:hypothetical protein n=1 Tax=unclassified Nonomuraea TaxID=2593643 RepID=UPI0033F21907
MSVWRGPDGIQIEIITLGRRTCYRVTQLVNGRRYLLATTRHIHEIEVHVAWPTSSK